MAAFEYVALDASGKKSKGIIAADSARAARRALRMRELVPVDVLPVSGKAGASGKLTGGKLSEKDRTLLARQLAVLLQSGLTVEQALTAASSDETKPDTVAILQRVRSEVTEGATFANALASAPKAFPPLFRSVVASGELSGRQGEVMERLAIYLENTWRLRQKVRSALIYPALLSIMALGMVAGTMLVDATVARVAVEAERPKHVITILYGAVAALMLGGMRGVAGLAAWFDSSCHVDALEPVTAPTLHAARAAGGKHNRRNAAASAWRQGRRRRARCLFTRQGAQFNFLEQAANTHGADIIRRHSQPREKPLQHPIKSIQLRAARTARQHHGGDFADMPKAEQIAGINRHAEMINHAAGAHDGCRANIAPIHHGGSARHQQHFSARAT
jgi:hypothetical protein